MRVNSRAKPSGVACALTTTNEHFGDISALLDPVSGSYHKAYSLLCRCDVPTQSYPNPEDRHHYRDECGVGVLFGPRWLSRIQQLSTLDDPPDKCVELRKALLK